MPKKNIKRKKSKGTTKQSGVTVPKDGFKKTVLGSNKSREVEPEPKTKPLNAFQLLFKSFDLVFRNWQLFGPILILYYVFSLVLVYGFSNTLNISQLQAYFHRPESAISNGFGYLEAVVNSGSSSTGSNGYQTFLLIIFSLVFIYIFRQLLANVASKIGDAFYRSCYPIIQFLLIGCLIVLELFPGIIGLYLIETVFGGGIAAHAFEKVIWAIVCVALIVLSLYWISSSLFALFVVTVPDTRPMQALRTAKKLVRKRRLLILRKLVFLPVVLSIIIGVITVLLGLIAPPIAGWLFYAQTATALAVGTGYIYLLYRDLI